MKNEMIELYKYNVILMDWRRYNQPPYFLAAVNTLLVGHELANMIQFLDSNEKMDPRNVHLIGHSLGAHVAGAAGKETPNLGRITGLDPARPLFSDKSILHRLTYTDADFVDVIHTNIDTLGFGIPEPIGDQDFYPNGGYNQPECVANQYSEIREPQETLGEESLEDPFGIGVNICDHSAAVLFYMESVNTTRCAFSAVPCRDYGDFRTGACPDGPEPAPEMGLPARPTPGLGPAAKLYLRTGASPPYCLEDGDEPE